MDAGHIGAGRTGTERSEAARSGAACRRAERVGVEKDVEASPLQLLRLLRDQPGRSWTIEALSDYLKTSEHRAAELLHEAASWSLRERTSR